jgi:hypothetical protein
MKNNYHRRQNIAPLQSMLKASTIFLKNPRRFPISGFEEWKSSWKGSYRNIITTHTARKKQQLHETDGYIIARGGAYFLFLIPIGFLMSVFRILVPGVPTNCIGDSVDAPAAATGDIDDGGAGTGGMAGVSTGAGTGTVWGACEGAGAGVGSGGGRGKMCFSLLFL